MYACLIDDLDHVVWKDFFGGSDEDQGARGIAVREGTDPKVYVGGWTSCTDFYCFDANPGNDYFDDTGSGMGSNGFIVRLNQVDGVLEHSTYFGTGTPVNEVADITIDPSGRLIAVGTITPGNLPTHQVALPPGAEQWPYGGAEDGYVALFNLNDQVLWSTPWGGSGSDGAVTVRAKGNKIVVVGHTGSVVFPQTLNGGGNWNQSTTLGLGDVVILEFNLNGDQQWGALFGGSGMDQVGWHGLDIDPVTSDIYVVGYTRSTDLPLYHPNDWYDATPPPAGIGNGFIAEFSNSRNRLWVTYAGSSDEAYLHAVRISQDRQIFIGGYAAAGFPCQPRPGLYSTATLLGGQDGVVMHFDAAHQYLWGTYLGGENSERIYTIAVKEGERLYTCGYTTTQYLPAELLPLTDENIPGSWFEDVRQGSLDGYLAAFCFDDVVGILSPVGTVPAELRAWTDVSGHLFVAGATPGMQPLLMCDPTGRVALHMQVRVPSDAPLRIDPGSLAAGAYVLSIGDRSAKVAVLQP